MLSGVITVSDKVVDAFRAGELESVTLKVNGVAFTAAVGFPLSTPALDSVKPAGSVPAVNCQL